MYLHNLDHQDSLDKMGKMAFLVREITLSLIMGDGQVLSNETTLNVVLCLLRTKICNKFLWANLLVILGTDGDTGTNGHPSQIPRIPQCPPQTCGAPQPGRPGRPGLN